MFDVTGVTMMWRKLAVKINKFNEKFKKKSEEENDMTFKKGGTNW